MVDLDRAQPDRPIKEVLLEPRIPVESMWLQIASRRRRMLPSVSLAAYAAALSVAFLVGLVGVSQLVPRERSWVLSSPEVASPEPLTRADGQRLGALDTSTTGVALDVAVSDGSRIRLEPGAKLVTSASNGRLFRATIAFGKVAFDVKPHGSRRWVLDAGDTQVSVLGTRFSVELTAEWVAVEVERGRVEVRGPRISQGSQVLGPGERLALPPPQTAAVDSAAAKPGPGVVAATGARALDGAETERNRAARPVSSQSAPPLAAKPHADQLLKEADAARLAGQYDRAERLLRRLLADHPDDVRAALVALTLGRLQLDQLKSPQRAASSFARANALGLPAALAEEGAARLVEAQARAGRMDLARAAATRYRERFPNGQRRANVEAWIH